MTEDTTAYEEIEGVRGDGPCVDCGTDDNPMWFAPSPFWNEVMGPDDRYAIVCPYCFARRVYRAGFRPQGFEIRPNWPWWAEVDVARQTAAGSSGRPAGARVEGEVGDTTSSRIVAPSTAPEPAPEVEETAGGSISPIAPPETTTEVDRVEVIGNTGRLLVKRPVSDVVLSIQDSGRTLKVFLTEPEETAGQAVEEAWVRGGDWDGYVTYLNPSTGGREKVSLAVEQAISRAAEERAMAAYAEGHDMHCEAEARVQELEAALRWVRGETRADDEYVVEYIDRAIAGRQTEPEAAAVPDPTPETPEEEPLARAERAEAERDRLREAVRHLSLRSMRFKGGEPGIGCDLCMQCWEEGDAEDHRDDCLAALAGESTGGATDGEGERDRLRAALEEIATDAEGLACSDLPHCPGGDHASDCAVGIARRALAGESTGAGEGE